jgi:hypothetical protein
VTVEVRAFDELATALAAAAAPEPGRLARGATEQAAARETPPELLTAAAPGGAPPLLEIDVRVRWLEGADEQEVTRTSFAADPTIVATALAALGDGDAADADDETDEDEAVPEAGEPGAFPESPGGELPFPVPGELPQ